jgi:RNA polymerase sigma-70 factor, ECF subfamily
MPETSISLLERLNDRADRDAWRRLVDLYSPLIAEWLRRYGVPPSEVDDLVQEVLGVLVRQLPQFRHNRRVGAFRHWLRSVVVNCLRRSYRARRHRASTPGATDFAAVLDQLEDPDSGLSRLWDEEHDRHVTRRLLEWAEPEFQEGTWRAFRRQVLEGASAAEVAAELGTTVNAVAIAKSRVLKHLRQQSLGLID